MLRTNTKPLGLRALAGCRKRRGLGKCASDMEFLVRDDSDFDGGAAPAPSGLVNLLYNLQVCEGKYALCAASICTPTEGTIAVNVAGGGTALFPEAACTW